MAGQNLVEDDRDFFNGPHTSSAYPQFLFTSGSTVLAERRQVRTKKPITQLTISFTVIKVYC